MVNSKKLLSLFLAVVMILSTFSVMAFAYTVGPEVAGDINFKYTVEKVDTVPETAAGSAEWTADNIYAVSVWMQCDSAVPTMTAPVHFDKTLFSPITLSDGECTYPYGAGFGVDDYYDTMGEGAVYAYSLGDYMNNTGMYKANGTAATTKALAKCIGLGNANSEGVDVIAELVGPGHPLYNKWGAGLSENTGVLYVNLDVASKTKTAYLNTIEGITTSQDWNKMFTFYFEAIADDVTGAEFGVFTDDCYTVDGFTDDAGYGYFVNATTSVLSNPNKNVVSNAVVEETVVPSIITNGKPGIRFEKNADGTYANKISVRTKAQIAAGDLQGLIGGITDNDAVEKKILEAGFVYIADANGTLNATTAQTVAKTKADGESVDSHIKKSVSYIQYDGTNYSFTCLITPIEQADIATASFNTYAYIVIDVDGDGVADDNEWYFANAEGNAVSAKTLYNNLNDDAWEAYGWGTATDL